MAASSSAKSALPDGGGGKPLEILILDDMATDRMRLKRLCRRAGLVFRATEASNITELHAALDRAVFDIAFVDYALGIGTGLDAIEILNARADQREAIAIMVSTLDDLDLAVRAMRLGCADYINKEELTIESIRKSLALAFERRLLMKGLFEAKAAESEIRQMLLRLARTSGVEISSVVASVLQQVRAAAARSQCADDERLSHSVEQLDQLCNTLVDHLAELGGTGALVSDASFKLRAIDENLK